MVGFKGSYALLKLRILSIQVREGFIRKSCSFSFGLDTHARVRISTRSGRCPSLRLSKTKVLTINPVLILSFKNKNEVMLLSSTATADKILYKT